MVATGKMAAASMISEYYIVAEDGKKKCKICDDPDKANVYGSTTLNHNLFKHLNATHNLNLFGGQIIAKRFQFYNLLLDTRWQFPHLLFLVSRCSQLLGIQ
jgi:hypothetical protein